MNIKKLSDILFVRREETNNKWWHRLFTVFLFGSGIVVYIFSFLLTTNNREGINTHWFTYTPVAFSLESNYQQVSGKELPCDRDIDSSNMEKGISFIIKCDGVNIPLLDARKYNELYKTASSNLEKQFGLDKYNGEGCSNLPHNVSGTGFSKEEKLCLDKLDQLFKDEKLDPVYPEYQKALKDLAKIKVKTHFNFAAILNPIVYWLVIPIVVSIIWIIFWSSIVYRSILYIIFGKNNK